MVLARIGLHFGLPWEVFFAFFSCFGPFAGLHSLSSQSSTLPGLGGSCVTLLCRLFQVMLPGSVSQWLCAILDDFKVALVAHGRATGTQGWSPWLPVSIPHRDPGCCKKRTFFQARLPPGGGCTQNPPEKGVEACSSLEPHFAHLGSHFGTHLVPSFPWGPAMARSDVA